MDIDTKTSFIGLLGKSLSHSISPKLHNGLYRRMNINSVYIPIEACEENLENVLLSMNTLNFKGFNVTIPYKQTIMKFLDKIDESALIVGAVNTVRIENGLFIGYNTDAQGFIKSLDTNDMSLNNKDACILGAGGAAKAIATACLSEKINNLFIINRTDRNALKLKEALKGVNDKTNVQIIKQSEIETKNIDYLINTTPVGMFPRVNSIPIDKSLLNHFKTVIDIIYNPDKTLLLENAELCDCNTLNGLGMLIWQALLSINIWFEEIELSPYIYKLCIRILKS